MESLYAYFNDDEENRIFEPSLSRDHRHVPENELVIYTREKQVSQLQWPPMYTNKLELDRNTMVVYIDGACRNNGKPTARASWGVCFGPGSRYNACALLDPSLPQTSSRAEIEALSQALDIVISITSVDPSLGQVKIVTDSEYLVDALTEHMEHWIENGGAKANGRPVAHFEKLKELYDKIQDMEYSDDGGVVVNFWSVLRGQNTEADRLANQAFGI